jgi:hypothetical protein
MLNFSIMVLVSGVVGISQAIELANVPARARRLVEEIPYTIVTI